MRKLLALAICFGCSSGSDRTFEGVQALDRATLEDNVYYIDLSVADTPLSLEEVQDPEGAIPVRLLTTDRLVVAVAIDLTVGSDPLDRVMGAWKINPDLVPNGGADDETVGTGGNETPVAPSSRATRPTPGQMLPDGAGSAEVVVDWELADVGISPDDLDILIDFHPSCF